MKIRIISVGKIKEKYLRDGIAEYAKRLGKYCTLEQIEVQDEKTPDGAPPSIEEKIKMAEGERILSHIRPSGHVILLDLGGRKMDSVQFAAYMESCAVNGISAVDFVIGGSLGVSGEVRKRADLRLSFSDMTFPHQLMKLILTEQIYRSFRIRNHEPYHK